MRTPRRPRRLFVAVQGGALGLLAAGAVLAAQPGSSVGGIYTCVTPDGRKVTSDRPIPECTAREQRLLNRDGSLKQVIPPVLTADERAEKEARERKAELERLAQLDAVRRDRHLVARYPDETSHTKAREAALDTVRLAMKASEKRMEELAAERRPLLQESEFYKGKALPPKLKQQLDANDAAVDAQRSAILNQQAELERINRLYDAELSRLKKLWAGAAPGTVADGGEAAAPKTRKP